MVIAKGVNRSIQRKFFPNSEKNSVFFWNPPLTSPPNKRAGSDPEDSIALEGTHALHVTNEVEKCLKGKCVLDSFVVREKLFLFLSSSSSRCTAVWNGACAPIPP